MPDGLPFSFAEMLARMQASDATADGLFVTGVVTTGIYCRPSCPARTPKPENVVFFATVADAAATGLRACRRCRPDEHGLAIDRDRDRFTAALDVLEADPAAVPDLAALAGRAGVGVSTLHVFARRYAGTTPGELLHASRIRAAQRLLLAGTARASDVPFAVGYASASAFYRRFRAATGQTPAAFARLGPAGRP